MNTKISPCNCNHLVQDALYGSGNRLHNMMEVGNWRCTVCSHVKEGKKTQNAKEEKKNE